MGELEAGFDFLIKTFEGRLRDEFGVNCRLK